MSQEEQCEGTGLRKVYDILVSVPPEQVLSLTFYLGDSPEDNIIHALCLMILRKEEKALNQLQMLGDNCLAKLLSEIWRRSGCKLENFAEQCGQTLDLTGESLVALARVFKILSEHQLCDQLLRNLAYKRALSSNSLRTDSREDLLYDQLKEEAKDVCGPQLAVWLCSSGDLKSDSYNLAPNSQFEGVTTHVQSLPSSLQSSCSEPSYPSHLEISLPPTIPYEGDQVTPENPEQKPIDSLNDCNPPEQSHLSSVESTEAPGLEKAKMAAASGTEHQDGGFNVKPPCEQSTTSTTGSKPSLPFPPNHVLPKRTVSLGAHLNQYVEEEDEVIFYSFVILHAPEDGEVAESMKEKVESIVGTKGATFSEDFSIPGKSTLRCIEDAINNSAFTILLLTQNFNTRMLEVKTNSALINSITNQHKNNTVIPFLPKDNCMPRHRIPIVLQTLVPLEENKSFESKIKKVLSPAKIHRQRSIWSNEQRKHQRQLAQGCEAAHMLENLNFQGSSEASLLQKRPNIRIENASYVMIGDNCHMTVDHCDLEDPIVREKRK
ncbi:TIR domain-containing adapter molecule 1 [Syngnathus typhle]|uniref:TIR domain-containing adapter molecule 1 n=1 Tax=Syngnathus typhle TaxID=161592 RepID=UPI002A6B26A0|nr:TIR domain-containing adapter molecule 1 [Syngnathus typhle]XP_061151892.1 TIR domain-containing adapter molecule 1 [Syngnathus typhle]XP_061151893.1 TIR domain-containing adapter molecule 1 [Syngnathus typhle]XP_061151894.1 TIR domain-containing adapter molecule 1 [Syngnathus typhle]